MFAIGHYFIRAAMASVMSAILFVLTAQSVDAGIFDWAIDKFLKSGAESQTKQANNDAKYKDVVDGPDIKFWAYAEPPFLRGEALSVLVNAEAYGVKVGSANRFYRRHPKCDVLLNGELWITTERDYRPVVTPDKLKVGSNKFDIYCYEGTGDGRTYHKSFTVEVLAKYFMTVDKTDVQKYDDVFVAWDAPHADGCVLDINGAKTNEGVSGSKKITVVEDTKIDLRCEKPKGAYYYGVVDVAVSGVNEGRRPFVVTVDGTDYEQRDGEVTVPLGSKVTVSWNADGTSAESCEVSIGGHDWTAQGTFDRVEFVPYWTQRFRLRCEAAVSCSDGDDACVNGDRESVFGADVNLKVVDSAGDEVSHDTNRPQLGFYASKQVGIAVGEEITLRWARAGAVFSAKPTFFTSCKLSILKEGDASFQIERTWNMAALDQIVAGDGNIYYPVAFDAVGTYKAMLSCFAYREFTTDPLVLRVGEGGGTAVGETSDEDSVGKDDSDDVFVSTSHAPVKGEDFTFDITVNNLGDHRADVTVNYGVLSNGVVCSFTSSDNALNVQGVGHGGGATVTSTVTANTTYRADCQRGNKTTAEVTVVTFDEGGNAVIGSAGGSGAVGSDSDSASDSSDASSASDDGAAPAFTFTVNGKSDQVKLPAGQHFTLQWSMQPSDGMVCDPSGAWDIDMVRKKDSSLITYLIPVVNLVPKLKPVGTLQVSGVTQTATFTLVCRNRGDIVGITKKKRSVTVIIDGDGADAGGGTVGDAADGQVESVPDLITVLKAEPETVPSGGVVDITFGAVAGATCEIFAQKEGLSARHSIQRGDYYAQDQTYTRPYEIGQLLGDGLVTITMTCTKKDGNVTKMQQQSVQVRVGATAGIRYFTADRYHLDAPGKVWISYETFGMKSCKVSKKELDNKGQFREAKKAKLWSTTDGSYSVEKTTEFILTCTPEDESGVQRKTLTVSVGGYTGSVPIEGTENAQYTQYCPFNIDHGNGIDYMAYFSQRLEWAGQKDVVNGVSVPAGKYTLLATSSDTYDGRSDAGAQPNERYYIEFYDKNGGVVAKSDVSEDLNDATVHGAVTLQQEIVLDRPVTSLAAVHADGENGSFNPGCVLLKRSEPYTDAADAQAQGDVSGSGAAAQGANGDATGAAHALTNGACERSIPATARTAFATAYRPRISRCDSGSVVARIGGTDGIYYTWHTAYYTVDGKNFSQQVAVEGQKDATGQWIVGEGTVALPGIDNGTTNYVIAYTCKYVGGTWDCGCAADGGACTDPAAGRYIWQATGVHVDTAAR